MTSIPPLSGQAQRIHPIGVRILVSDHAAGGATRVLQESPAAQRQPAGVAMALPAVRTPLLGRDDEITAVVELTRRQPVVTITGPGGVGKTSLALELGRRLAPDFSGRVLFVTLADITDPAEFVPAVANALDVKEAEGRSLFEGLVALIGSVPTLLLLDNLEQIVAAAPNIAQLVQRCPAMRVVVTSRTPLRISGEHEYVLGSLALPPSTSTESAETLRGYPSVALFVERAGMARGSFELTDGNAATLAAICRRLDGLPLAIELAAARLRLLTPDALLERLNHALDVLTAGARDAPTRQQTLRATIDWSHSLLSPAEQRLFRRMSVFAGGCAFDDVEAVCADPGEASLDELEAVLDKALIQVDPQGTRLSMLQTIAEYARERLDASGEVDAVTRRHADHYARVVHDLCLGVEGSDQLGSMARGITDEGNVVTALDTLLAAARTGSASACETGMRMCGDLLLYWHIRGKNLTARQYAQAFLDADTVATASVGRAGSLVTAGLASWTLGEFERSINELMQAQEMALAVRADRERCCALFLGAVAQIGFDLERGLAWTRDCIAHSRAVGFTWGEGFGLAIDGILHTVNGDADTARQQYQAALDIQRRIGDEEGAGLSLGGLAQLASMRGDLAGALDLYQQSLEAFEACGDRAEEARILSEMAWAYLQHGDSTQARRFFFDSVHAYTDVASVRGIGLSLVGLAATEAAVGRPANAVRIASAAEVYANQQGIVNVYSDETPGLRLVDAARARLSADEVDRATEEGRRLTIKEALDLAKIAQTNTA